jgi:hypothetical protein
MTKTIWTGTCSAIVGLVTAAVTAQTPTPPQNSSTNSERSIVVTGCLKPAPSSPTDTSAAAGTPALRVKSGKIVAASCSE